MITGTVYDCDGGLPLPNADITLKDAGGRTLQTTTGADGRYLFPFNGNDANQIAVSKDGYNDKASGVSIEGKSETAWHTDTLFNAALCLEKKKLVIKVENVVTVYFDFDRSALKDRSRAQLDSIYNVLMEDSTTTLQISGYTDGLGSAEYNAKLSDRRAKSCADYLISKGIAATRISFESFGACCPVEMELINGRDNPDGRSMNRRALINIDKREAAGQ